MAKINKPNTAEEAPASEEKPKRTALLNGIPRVVDRSYYKAEEDCVIDVLLVEKTVQNRKGEDVEVTLHRHVYCKDEAIQAKYRKGTGNVEVDI